MKKDTKDKLIAATGAAGAGAVLKQVVSVDAHSGYAQSLENKLKKYKVPDKLAYHIAGISRRIPAAAVGTPATLLTYDLLGGRGKGDTEEKITKALVAGAVSTVASLPLHTSIAKLPSEYKDVNKFNTVLKNRALQSMLSAPAALLTYDYVKKKTDSPLVAALGAAGAGAAVTLPIAAKYEALIPEVEQKAVTLGNKLEGSGKFFRMKLGKQKTTLGRYLGRTIHSIGPRTLGGVLAAAGTFAAYDVIKKKLEKKK